MNYGQSYGSKSTPQMGGYDGNAQGAAAANASQYDNSGAGGGYGATYGASGNNSDDKEMVFLKIEKAAFYKLQETVLKLNLNAKKMSYDDIKRVICLFTNFIGSACIADKVCQPNYPQYSNGNINNYQNGMNMVMPPNPNPMGMTMGMPFNGMNFNYYGGMNMPVQQMAMSMGMGMGMGMNIGMGLPTSNGNGNGNNYDMPMRMRRPRGGGKSKGDEYGGQGRRERQGYGDYGYDDGRENGYYGNRYGDNDEYADDESDYDPTVSRKTRQGKMAKNERTSKYENEKGVGFDLRNVVNSTKDRIHDRVTNNRDRVQEAPLAKTFGILKNHRYNNKYGIIDEDDDDEDIVVNFDIQFNNHAIVKRAALPAPHKPKIHFSDDEEVNVFMDQIFGNYRDSDNGSDYENDNELDFDFEGDLIRFAKEIDIDHYISETEEITDEDILNEDENKDDQDEDEFKTQYRGRFTLPITFDEFGEFVKFKIALRGGEITDEEDSDDDYDDDDIDRPDGTMMIVIDDDKEIEINRYHDTIISPNKFENIKLHSRRYKSLKNQHKNHNRNTKNKIQLPADYDKDEDFDYMSNNTITIDLPSDTFQVDTMFARLVDEDGNYIDGCNWYAIEMTSLAGKRMRKANETGKEPDIFREDCDPDLKEEVLTSLEHIGNMYKHVDLIAPLDEDIDIETYDPSFEDYEILHEDDDTEDESDVEYDNDGDIPVAHNKNRLFGKEIKAATKIIKEKRTIQVANQITTIKRGSFVTGTKISIKSVAHNKFMCADRKGIVTCDRDAARSLETFSVVSLGNNKYGIKAPNNTNYFGVIPKGKHYIQHNHVTHLKSYETFELVYLANEDVYGIKTHFGKFISAQSNGSIECDRTRLLSYEKFKIDIIETPQFGSANFVETTLMAGKAAPTTQQRFGSRIKRAANKVASGTKKLGSTVGKGVSTAAKKTGSGIKTAATKTASGVKTAATKTASGVKTAAKKTASGVKTAATAVGNVGKTVGKGIGNAAKTVGRGIDAAISAVANTPLGKSLHLDKHYENMKKGFVKLSTKVAKGFKKVMKAIGAFIKAGIGFIVNAVKKLIEFIAMLFNFGNIVKLAKNIKYVMIRGMNVIIFNNINTAAVFLKKHLVGNLNKVVDLLKTDEVEELTETPDWAKKIANVMKKGMGAMKKGLDVVNDKIISPVKDAIGKIVGKIFDNIVIFHAPKFLSYMAESGLDLLNDLLGRVKNILNIILNSVTFAIEMIVNLDFDFMKMIRLVKNALAGLVAEIIGILADAIDFVLTVLSKLQFEDLFPLFRDNFIRKFFLFIMGQNAKVPGSKQGKKDVGMLDILCFMMAFSATFVQLATFNDRLSKTLDNRDMIDGLLDNVADVFGQNVADKDNDSNDDSKEDNNDDDDNVERFGQVGAKNIGLTNAGNGDFRDQIDATLNGRRVTAFYVKALSSVVGTGLSAVAGRQKIRTVNIREAESRRLNSLTERTPNPPSPLIPIGGAFLELFALLLTTDYTDKKFHFTTSLITCIINVVITIAHPLVKMLIKDENRKDKWDKFCKSLNWAAVILRNLILMGVNFKIVKQEAKGTRQRFQGSSVGTLCLLRILHAACDFGVLFTKNPKVKMAAVVLGTTQFLLWTVLAIHGTAASAEFKGAVLTISE